MRLTNFRVRNVRCIERADVLPAPGVNLIIGPNGAGKTSLLEAIYLLGHGCSFRETSVRPLIRDGTEGFMVRGDVARDKFRPVSLGAVWSGGSMRLRCGTAENASRLDLIRSLSVQVLDPNLHRLIEDGPQLRRKFLDWGVFHVEHSFFPAWRRYRRALMQRNLALRAGQTIKAVTAWDGEILSAGNTVDAARRAHLGLLQAQLPELLSNLLGEVQIKLDYHPGWSGPQGFDAALKQSLASDRQSGFTHPGPHRADLRVIVSDARARSRVSRGEQKLLSAGLFLAQAELVKKQRGFAPVLLMDDLSAELDVFHRRKLLGCITNLGGQCFVTTLDDEVVKDAARMSRMFHVEHGCLRTVAGTGA